MKKEALKARGIRFSDEIWKRLKKCAKRHGVTPSDVVRHAVDEHFLREKNSKTKL